MSVLILSHDSILANALRSELKLEGIEAEIAESASERETRLILCDIDSVQSPSHAITITRSQSKKADFHRPFRTTELIADVVHRLTLQHSSNNAEAEIQIDKLFISENLVRLGNREIQLTATEASLLTLLASRPGIPFSREEIERAVWGKSGIGTNRCEVYIRYLRQKLEQPDAPKRILTVRGKGYMLSPLI